MISSFALNKLCSGCLGAPFGGTLCCC